MSGKGTDVCALPQEDEQHTCNLSELLFGGHALFGRNTLSSKSFSLPTCPSSLLSYENEVSAVALSPPPPHSCDLCPPSLIETQISKMI